MTRKRSAREQFRVSMLALRLLKPTSNRYWTVPFHGPQRTHPILRGQQVQLLGGRRTRHWTCSLSLRQVVSLLVVKGHSVLCLQGPDRIPDWRSLVSPRRLFPFLHIQTILSPHIVRHERLAFVCPRPVPRQSHYSTIMIFWKEEILPRYPDGGHRVCSLLIMSS